MTFLKTKSKNKFGLLQILSAKFETPTSKTQSSALHQSPSSTLSLMSNSNSCQTVLSEISAIHGVNNEIISQLNSTKEIHHVYYSIDQEQLTKLNEPPRYKAQKHVRKTLGSTLLKKSVTLSIKPHLFSEDSNKSIQVIGYSAIVAQNSQQMTIVQKYKKFGENATAHEELCILLENFEQIQVSLGTYQKDFLQERDSTYESVQKEVAEINEKFSNLFKQYSFQPPIGFESEVFTESKFIAEIQNSQRILRKLRRSTISDL